MMRSQATLSSYRLRDLLREGPQIAICARPGSSLDTIPFEGVEHVIAILRDAKPLAKVQEEIEDMHVEQQLADRWSMIGKQLRGLNRTGLDVAASRVMESGPEEPRGSPLAATRHPVLRPELLRCAAAS